MDTGKMKCFLTVAEYMSFSKASEVLYISQSAVSKQIASLESEIGLPLFVRSARDIRLTTSGQVACKYFEKILQLNDNMDEELSQLAEADMQEVVIRSGPFANRAGYYEMMYNLQKAYPNINIKKERLGPDAYSDICRGKYSIVVEYWAGGLPQGLKSHVLKYDRFAIVMRADNPLLKKERVSMRELSNENWVFPNRFTTLFDHCSEMFRSAGFWPRINSVEHMLVSGYVQNIIEGGCVALLPEIVANNIGNPDIKVIKLNKEYPVNMMLFYKPSKNRNINNVIRYLTGIQASPLNNLDSVVKNSCM